MACKQNSDIELGVPVGMDLDSPAGGVVANRFRLLVNLLQGRDGHLRRIGGWSPRGWDGQAGNNADLHDQLLAAVGQQQTVTAKPFNVRVIAPLTLTEGVAAEFRAVAEGAVDEWNWLFTTPDGATLAQGATFVLTPQPGWAGQTVTASVEASNGCGFTSSGDVVTLVQPALARLQSVTLTANPVPQEVGLGVLLTAQTVPDFVATDTWRWFRNGIPVPGSTTNGYGFDAGPDTDGQWFVEVTRGGQVLRSAPVTVSSVCPALATSVTGPVEVTNATSANWTFLAESVVYSGREYFGDVSRLFIGGTLAAEAPGRSASFTGLIPLTGRVLVTGEHQVGSCVARASLEVLVTPAGGPAEGSLLDVEEQREVGSFAGPVRFSTLDNTTGTPLTIRWSNPEGNPIPSLVAFVNLLIGNSLGSNWNSGADQTVPAGSSFRVELTPSEGFRTAVAAGEPIGDDVPAYILVEIFSGAIRLGSRKLRLVNLVLDINN